MGKFDVNWATPTDISRNGQKVAHFMKWAITQTGCNICAKPKNRMRNSVSFLLKCKKRGTLVGPTFFGTFFGQKYGKNSAASKQK